MRSAGEDPIIGGFYRLLRCCAALLPFMLCAATLRGQSADSAALSQKVQELSSAIDRAQAQMDESRRQLDEMREELKALQQELAAGAAVRAQVAPQTPSSVANQPDDGAEREQMQATQIATLAQEKVESESKYPVKLSGMVLFTAFANTSDMDMPATPTAALFGPGSAGATLRQTTLGIDGRGPHLLGAQSSASLRIDFDGQTEPAGNPASSYAGAYNVNATIVRLRTARAALRWRNTEVFFALDKPILTPDTPTSLTAVAEPALAWSGNLWSWNPQAGVEHYIGRRRGGVLLQAAFIDPSDAPATLVYKARTLPTTAENRMRPGGELRVAWTGADRDQGAHAGIGGYFSPHRSTTGIAFNAWAATADVKLPIGRTLELTGSGYRGQALGGLGGGAYKDFIAGTYSNGTSYFQSIDGVGGWMQLKEKLGERLQFNEAFGMDQAFARQLRLFATAGSLDYVNFARNRTWTVNTIFTPSAYLLFSFEFRRVETAPVLGRLWTSNVFGAAAGYRF